MKIKLQYKIIGPISILFLLAIMIAFWRVRARSQEMLEFQIKDHVVTLTESVSTAIKTQNELELRGLDTIACIPQIKSLDKTFREKTDIIDGIVTDCIATYYDMGIIDSQGKSILYHSEKTRSFADNIFFKEALRGKAYISDPYNDPSYGTKYVMSYGYPVKAIDDSVIAVVFSTIDGFKISEIAAEQQISEHTDISVFNRETGYVIGNQNQDNVDYSTHNIKDISLDMNKKVPEFSKVLNDALLGNADSHFCKIDGHEVIVAYAPIEGTNWSVLVQAPYEDFNAREVALVNVLIRIFALMLLGLIVVGLLIIRETLRPLKKVKLAVEDLASGNADLTKRISNHTHDEIGDVVSGFNVFTEKLHQIMAKIKDNRVELTSEGQSLTDISVQNANNVKRILQNINEVNDQIINQSSSVEQTAGAVNEIASNIASLEKMIENQTMQVSGASAAVEEMIGNINSVNQSVEMMVTSFNELENTAQTGSDKQSDVNEKIHEIELQSETLQDANQAIASIAHQTNLLAMNAAIEAAHAGEAGKGFSVVADEIRKLSETSSSESKTIGDQLKKIQNLIMAVVSASGQSAEAFVAVTDKIKETDNFVKQIKSAMAEQTEGSKQINQSLQSMNDSTLEVRSASTEMAEGNQAILEEVKRLQEATHEMKSSVNQMKDGAEEVRNSEVTLTQTVDKMYQSIEQIGTQIDQFKV